METAVCKTNTQPEWSRAEVLQYMMENISAGVAAFDDRDCLLACNERFVKMLARAGLLSQALSEMDTSRFVGQRLTDFAPGLKGRPGKLSVASGRQYALTYSGDAGQDSPTIVTMEDVTSGQIHAEAVQNALVEQERIQNARNTFVSQVAHHFRTPLNVILGYVDILMSGSASGVDQTTRSSYLEFIRESAAALLLNMNEMMDIIRLQRGEQDVEIEQRDISTLFKGVISELEQVFEAEAATLNCTGLLASMEGVVVYMDARLARRGIASILRTCAVLGGESSILTLQPASQSAQGRYDVMLEFKPGRSHAPEIMASIREGEPVKEISLTGNASGYGLVLATHLLRLSQAELRVSAANNGAVSIVMSFNTFK